MKWKLFTGFYLMFLFWSLNKAHSHSPVCDVLMSPPDEVDAFLDPSFGQTDRLIAYLESLLEEGVFEDDHFSSFISGLEKDRVLNPLQDQEGSAAAIQRGGIQEYIDRGGLDKDRLLKWARLKRAEKNRIWVVRDDVREVTQGLHRKMEFHPVRVGSFQMSDGRNKKEVSLTYPIEVMSTPVTQMHWVQLMGENPSRFVEGEHSMVVARGEKVITLQPDHPVESINWWSALVFANRLSEKHGLKPVYDLSEVSWRPGTEDKAGAGALISDLGFAKIHANGGVHAHPYDGDIYYQTEGYRLPTEAEQMYLLQAGGVVDGEYYFDEDRLKDYAWYFENSGKKTHSVAELKPLILDGHAFYDLHGNVREWVWDVYGKFKGGRNPIGTEGTALRPVRGGGWNTSLSLMKVSYRGNASPWVKVGTFGFRLVRTIKSPEGISAE